MEQRYLNRLRSLQFYHGSIFDDVLCILDDYIRETGSDQLATAFSNVIDMAMEYDGYTKPANTWDSGVLG